MLHIGNAIVKEYFRYLINYLDIQLWCINSNIHLFPINLVNSVFYFCYSWIFQPEFWLKSRSILAQFWLGKLTYLCIYDLVNFRPQLRPRGCPSNDLFWLWPQLWPGSCPLQQCQYCQGPAWTTRITSPFCTENLEWFAFPLIFFAINNEITNSPIHKFKVLQNVF